MTTTIDPSALLGDLVVDDPRRSRVLDQFGLDYCCGGQRSLADACTVAGVSVADVAAALDLPDREPAPAWQSFEVADLARHVVDRHHAYLWEEMPRVRELVEKVATVHGERHQELAQVRGSYLAIVADLGPHLTKEERVLFPAIGEIADATRSGTRPSFPFGTLAKPIERMLREHDIVGDLFARIREITNDYAMPEDGCGSYQAMLSGLEEMEQDTHEHIHKENNVLFPRVLELESRLK